MHLITMAHLGEALSVIETFKLTKKGPELFVSENIVLLITGEGPFEAAIKTALLLPQYTFKEIINLGIAGTLDGALKVGEIHEIRTLYLIGDLKPSFKTMQASQKGVDCLTSFERILDPEKALKLRGLGKLVDREAWGIAMSAKLHGVTFRSFKIISDLAGTLDACELIKEKAPEFSQALAIYLLNYLGREPLKTPTTEVIPGFYFTFTTEHKFKSLLNKLSIKENETEEIIKTKLPLNDLRERKILPKERARLLLEEMENRIDPTKLILNSEKTKWAQSFEKEGLKVLTDPQWENPMVTVSFEASNDEEYQKKIAALRILSLKPFSNLMNGHFHVE